MAGNGKELSEHSTDWLEALADDAKHFEKVINRVESLGILACEHIREGGREDLKAALEKLAQMGEGIRLCKELLGIRK